MCWCEGTSTTLGVFLPHQYVHRLLSLVLSTSLGKTIASKQLLFTWHISQVRRSVSSHTCQHPTCWWVEFTGNVYTHEATPAISPYLHAPAETSSRCHGGLCCLFPGYVASARVLFFYFLFFIVIFFVPSMDMVDSTK